MPSGWPNWVFLVLVPVAFPIGLAFCLWKKTTSDESLQKEGSGIPYGIGALVVLATLLELVIGNYLLFRAFQPQLYWLYLLSFSFVPVVSGILAWSTLASLPRRMATTWAILFLPTILYGVLWYGGMLMHIFLLYHKWI